MSDQAKTIQEVNEAVAFMRKKIEEHGKDSSEAKAASARVEAALADFDKKNNELIAKQAEDRKAAEDLKSQVAALETSLARQSNQGAKQWKNSEEYKAVQAFLQNGTHSKSLRMDDSTQGGYLVPSEMSQEIIKAITEISPVRSLARVRTVSRMTLQVPTRTSIPTAAWEGELESNDSTKSAYGNETLTCHRLGADVYLTRDLLMDAAFDMSSEISSDVAEAFAKAEGLAFVSGNGVKQPEGFTANAAVLAASLPSKTTDTIIGDDMFLLAAQLKQGYNGTYGFNRATLAHLRTLKGTSNDHYIWQASLAPGAPATIGGMPYAILQDMQSIGGDQYPVVFGDFLRGYRITDRTGTMVIRDDLTRASYAQVKFVFARWLHGQVVLPEAIKLLKTT